MDRIDRNLVLIFGVTLIAIMGVTSISPAFPKMAKELEVSPERITMLITVFTLPGILLTPVLGIVADRFGRKIVLIPSLFLFGISGGMCFFIRDFNLLLFLRFFQGVGASSLGSLNVTLISDMYKGRTLSSAMGYNASVLSIGTALYPAIGGALAVFGWYFPFLLPFSAIPLAIVIALWLDSPEIKKNESFKGYLGNLWESLKNLHAISLFVASITTFIVLYGAYLTYFPFLLHRFCKSPLTIGFLMSCMSGTTAFTSSQLGRMRKYIGERSLVRTAFCIYAISLILFPMIHKPLLFLVPIVLFGIAHGINIPSIQTLLASIAPAEHRGAFMSVNGMVLRAGQTVGPVLMGLVYATGISYVFYVSALLSIFMALILSVALT